MEEEPCVIKVEHLVRTFKGYSAGSPEKVAVDDISFEVKKGEIFGLLGPNGAGKTTTIKMLSTLLIPTSGKVEILGLDVSVDKNVKALRSKINVVSGGERGLYYRLSGRQNLEFFSDLYSIPKKDQKELIPKLLELVELTDAADIKVENYSRGMKQRIHIARALINEPEVLYLDEPTIGLDPEISKDIRNLIRKLSEIGTTIILTTHYMFEAEELCGRMIILSDGKIAGKGTLEEIKESISGTSVIQVLTNDDPAELVTDLRSKGIDIRTVKLLNGRFVTKIVSTSKEKDVEKYDGMFHEYSIMGIGIEEPTLEDAYLTLVDEDRG